MQAFVDYVQTEFLENAGKHREGMQNALVRIAPPQIVRTGRFAVTRVAQLYALSALACAFRAHEIVSSARFDLGMERGFDLECGARSRFSTANWSRLLARSALLAENLEAG